jgi:hypothetical protein
MRRTLILIWEVLEPEDMRDRIRISSGKAAIALLSHQLVATELGIKREKMPY